MSDLHQKLEEAQSRSDSLLQSLESERARLKDMQQKHSQEGVEISSNALSFYTWCKVFCLLFNESHFFQCQFWTGEQGALKRNSLSATQNS